MGRLSIVLLLGLCPAVALADDEVEMGEEAVAKDPATAKKWLQAAQQLVRRGDAATRQKKPDAAATHYTNAITAYQKAIEAGDDPNVLFDLAAVEDKAGHFDRAATRFRAFVKLDGARPDLVKKAQARFDELTMKTGLVMINAKPDGTSIKLGGSELGTTPLDESLVMMPGTYTIVLAAEGHEEKELSFEVEPGSESERTIELDPIKTGVEPTPPEPEEPSPAVPLDVRDHDEPSKLPLYVGLGATGAFVLTATITGIVAVGKHSTFEDANASPADRADAKDSGKTFALVTDLALVGAVVAGGFTAYWYFAKYRPAQRNLATERAAKAGVVPWVKPGAGGLVLTGSF